MRRSKIKDKLADMIEEAIDAKMDEIMQYCEKHRLNYEMDLKVWKWGEEMSK